MAVLSCLLAALALGVTACGGDDDGGGGGGGGGAISGNKLTVYSSLPLQGPGRQQSLDVIRGEKLALKQRGGKVGKFAIAYESLDDSTAQAGKWEPGATSANARKAAQDDTAIAYLGEFNSGATALSLPILNEAGIMQVSPSNTALELTKDAGPDDKGAPEKYYPSGERTFARSVPADHIQGAALADWMKELDVKQLYILNDKEVYGTGVANTTSDAAEREGIEVLANEGIDPQAPNYRSVAEKIKSSGADAFFFGGIYTNGGIQLYKDLAAALPDAKLFGPDGVAETEFTEGLSDAAARQTYITVATINPKDYPAAGKKFFADYEKDYGDSSPEPYAIYGYEAMDILLTAMENAGEKANDRQAVIDEVYKIKNKKSVLGTYDIDKDGDVTLNQFGRYRVEDGELSILKTVTVAEDSSGNPLGGQ